MEKTTYRGAYNLYSSPSIVRVINLKRMGWAEHVACLGKCIQGFGGETRGKDTTWRTQE